MLRFARKLALIVFAPSSLPRSRRVGLAPHSIVLLLIAGAFFYSYSGGAPGLTPLRDSSYDPDISNAKCVVLYGFFESPELLANFEGTPAEMQRWVDLYDHDCR